MAQLTMIMSPEVEQHKRPNNREANRRLSAERDEVANQSGGKQQWRQPGGAYLRVKKLTTPHKQHNQNHPITHPQSIKWTFDVRRGLKFAAKKSKRLTTTIMAAGCSTKKPSCSLLVSIILPLLFVFLLPTLKLEQAHIARPQQLPSTTTTTTTAATTTTSWSSESGGGSSTGSSLPLIVSELLLTLVRFPFDRLRLVSGLAGSVSAKEINSKYDLQEEEQTNMLIQAPAEHRASYLAPTQQAPNGGGGYQQALSSRGHAYQGEGGPQMGGPHQADLHTGTGSPDYGGAPSDTGGGPSEGVGSVEGTALAETPGALQSGGSGGSSAGLQTRSDLPSVRALNVKCEKNHMTVNIVFDRPFYGMVFSKGHYNDQKCVHLPANSGQTSVNFDIHLGKCGMSSSDASGNPHTSALQQAATTNQQQQQPNGLYIENTIIIQYDPQVQEVFDQARKLRCTWYDYYEKSVTFRPYNVDMLDAVTANFLGDNIQCWMQIQVGKGPWSSEVAGIVKIGQTMTMVLAIKDDENRFDMLVRNCVAHDGKHQPIQLVDEYGCVARPKIMSKFQKVRNFGPAATVVSYAQFQAFKFPDSMSVHFQCVIQVCRYECPEPVCTGQPGGISGGGGASGGAGGGEIGGPSGPADYAASGTEIVSSKEPMPSPPSMAVATSTTNNGGYFGANNSMPTSSSQPTHGAAVQLKLDEAQGRVQVKLDTSMMAGLSGQAALSRAQAAAAAANGPLPPHLLHIASSSSSGSGLDSTGGQPPQHHVGYATLGSGRSPVHAHLNSPYYKPPSVLQHSHLQLGSATSGGNGGRHFGASGRAQMAPPGHPSVHYSSPYPTPSHQAHRPYATNRVGELASSTSDSGVAVDREEPTSLEREFVEHELTAATQQGAHPLSRIGSPRSLRMVASGQASFSSSSELPPHPNHRYRRSVSPLVSHNGTTIGTTTTSTSSPAAHTSQERHARNVAAGQQDSTAIKTQKTIQVVSPDDMAFSLLSDDIEPLFPPPSTGGGSGVSRHRTTQSINHISTVCFSVTKLLFAVLVTLAVLAVSIVIVAFVILRQRSRLDTQKLSTVYETTSSSDIPPAAASCAGGDGEIMQGAHDYSSGGKSSHLSSHQHHHHHQVYREEDLVLRRQREEIRQRNNYLARLYSQFVPATYWR